MTDKLDWERDPLWYKDAIIYQLHVKAFYDSNGDGTGDFRGLAEKLDYVQDLGVNAIWLLPFYPSPMRDDGYDIADYRDVHPDYGTRRDFRQFVREAHRRGIKVITELVINHTSDQHPWFQAARCAPEGSAKRNFYVWSKTKHKFAETRIIFTDTETSNWAWDDEAQAYYWHRFFHHQPDLNHNNPAVVTAVTRVMRFWLDMGVDGVRLDAIPYLCVRDGTNNENLPETHDVIRRMRRVVDEHYDNRMFLAEANQWPEDVRDYFGDGDECHMAYHFPLMPRMYMAIAQEDRHPVVEIMRQTPEIPDNCQWAVFLRNHDELTLEMVTDRERDYMYSTYASDPRSRVNVGIRRRLAPLMDNDPAKIKLMNSLLMSMPGSPIVYYGDEIGMGDNFYLGDRNGVRTPMQWSPDRNAGFSRADPQRLYLPPVMDAIYGYQAVNVEAQARDPSSLLNWMKRLIAVRKSHQAFGRGSLEFLRPGNRKILAYVRAYADESILCVANLSHTAQPVELDLSRYKGRIPLEVMGHIPFPPIGELPYLLTLEPHGVYWFLLTEQAEVPSWHEEHLPPMELQVLVLTAGWDSFDTEQHEEKPRRGGRKLRQQLEREVLPNWVPAQRWFAAKSARATATEVVAQTLWQEGDEAWLLTWVDVAIEGQNTQRYFLPLAMFWSEDEEKIWPLLHFTLAKVRQRARVGILFDAFSDERFTRTLLKAMTARRRLPFYQGELRFVPTRAFEQLVGELPADIEVRRPAGEGTNTAVVLGDRLFLKGYRRLHAGINPEIEIGRFLTEESPFANAIPVAGTVEYVPDGGGAPVSIALLQGYVENQGDAWNATLDYLDRFFQQCLVTPPEELRADAENAHRADMLLIHTLGLRTAELHNALARPTANPDFEPEPIAAAELAAWKRALIDDARSTLGLLGRATVPEHVRPLVDRLLERQPQLIQRIEALDVSGLKAVKSRYHGDFHLGQVLVVENDVMIIDFEGEPARPLDQRRTKHSPLRDVAGMLRSFSYAANAALYRASVETPEHFGQLAPHARDWQRLACMTFIEGYRSGNTSPESTETQDVLIEMFVLEKALYELRYELDNRPEWLRIPLQGLLAEAPDT